MKKLIFSLCFILLCSSAFADHWVYIRLEDRSGVETADDVGRSKAGDIVDIRFADYEPSEAEKASYAIVKVSGLTDEQISQYKEAWQEQDGIDELGEPIYISKAYRKYKLKNTWINNLSKGIYPSVIQVSILKNNIKIKTLDDLAKYELKRKFYAYVQRPLIRLANIITRKAWAETVSTINKTGQDYDTLTLWEDDKDGDLVTDTRQETAECYDDDGDLTDSNIMINGWITDSSYYGKITVPSTERHGGNVSSGFKVESTTGNNVFQIDNENLNFVFEYMIIKLNGGSTFNRAAIDCRNQTDGVDITIRGNIFYRGSLANNNHAIYIVNFSGNFYIINNIAYDYTTGSTFLFRGRWATNLYIYLYNNTIVDCSSAVYTTTDANYIPETQIYAKNNITNDCSSDCWGGDSTTWEAGTTHNLSSDTTTPELGTYYDSKDLTFSDYSSDDFHLDSTDSDAIDKGTSLASDGNYPFTDDIDGDTRTGTWDIGADEYISAATYISRVMIFK